MKARCEIDLSPGGRSRPISGPHGTPLKGEPRDTGTDCGKDVIEKTKIHYSIAKPARAALLCCAKPAARWYHAPQGCVIA